MDSDILYQESVSLYRKQKVTRLLFFGLGGIIPLIIIVPGLIKVGMGAVELNSSEWLLLIIQLSISIIFFLIFITAILRKPLKISLDHIELPYPCLILRHRKLKWLRKINYGEMATFKIIKHENWENKDVQEMISWELNITLKGGGRIKLKSLNEEMMKITVVKTLEQIQKQLTL